MTKRDCVMVKVTTEDGITGWGEVTGLEPEVAVALGQYGSRLAGLDPVEHRGRPHARGKTGRHAAVAPTSTR